MSLVSPPELAVHGTLFVPAAGEPSAAVLLIGGSGGSEPSCVGEALADEGVAALSVAYFARPGLLAQLRDINLEAYPKPGGIPASRFRSAARGHSWPAAGAFASQGENSPWPAAATAPP
jgi:hypothetical protein